MNDLYNALFGIDVVVMWEHEAGDPKRKHKKKRIAKKWLKKYGVWEEYDGACPKGRAFYINGTIYISRNAYAKLKQCTFKFEDAGHHGNNFSRY